MEGAYGREGADSPAGARGVNTGIIVRLLTSNTAWGFQNSAVANQSPSAVVDSSADDAIGAFFIRSRSFLVPRTMSMRSLLRPGRLTENSVAAVCGLEHDVGGDGAFRCWMRGVAFGRR